MFRVCYILLGRAGCRKKGRNKARDTDTKRNGHTDRNTKGPMESFLESLPAMEKRVLNSSS